MDGVSWLPYGEKLFDRGVAVGQTDIRLDAMHFKFRDELFTIPLARAMEVARHNGYYYEAPIDEVRRLEAEMAGG